MSARRRRRRLVVPLSIATLAIAWLISSGGDDGRSARIVAVDDAVSQATERRERRQVAAALERGVSRAAALGGTVQAAALLDSWAAPAEPVVVASPASAARQPMRMWSMSKVVTMVALLRALGWGEKPGDPLSPEAQSALEGAIRRSENCRQRRVVLELQEATGSAESARREIEDVLRLAGARADVGDEVEAPDASCLEYLGGQHEVPDPEAAALLLGVSTWRVGDAARFIAALGSGRYGAALAERSLGLMRAPKQASREISPGEFSAPLDWGAGQAFAGHDPAYKAGWGGTLQGAFMAGQIVSVELPGERRLALAVIFHPALQPPLDDPGSTAAPQALESVMEELVPLTRD